MIFTFFKMALKFIGSYSLLEECGSNISSIFSLSSIFNHPRPCGAEVRVSLRKREFRRSKQDIASISFLRVYRRNATIHN